MVEVTGIAVERLYIKDRPVECAIFQHVGYATVEQLSREQMAELRDKLTYRLAELGTA